MIKSEIYTQRIVLERIEFYKKEISKLEKTKSTNVLIETNKKLLLFWENYLKKHY
jgi:hypothetical protein